TPTPPERALPSSGRSRGEGLRAADRPTRPAQPSTRTEGTRALAGRGCRRRLARRGSCDGPRLPDNALVGPGELFVAVVDGGEKMRPPNEPDSTGRRRKVIHCKFVGVGLAVPLERPANNRSDRATKLRPAGRYNPHPVADLELAGHNSTFRRIRELLIRHRNGSSGARWYVPLS